MHVARTPAASRTPGHNTQSPWIQALSMLGLGLDSGLICMAQHLPETLFDRAMEAFHAEPTHASTPRGRFEPRPTTRGAKPS